MKKALEKLVSEFYVPWLFKIFLFIVFVSNTGTIGGFFRSLPPERYNHSYSVYDKFNPDYNEAVRRKCELSQYIYEKVKLAEAKGKENYSPYEYYSDLTEIYKKKKELDIDISVCNEINQLSWLMRNSLGKYSNDDFYKAQEKFNEYYDYIEKDRGKFDFEFFNEIKEKGWMVFWQWLFLVYVKTLPLAFVLYLIWYNEDRINARFYDNLEEKERLQTFRSPISFILMLIIYPFVITYVFIQKMRKNIQHYRLEAELRRTRKKLFTILSDDEIGQIKKFVQSNLSVNEWREHLSSQGLTYQHSLAAALTVTLIFVFIPRPVQAKVQKTYQGKGVALEQSISLNLARMNIEIDQDQKDHNHWDCSKDLIAEFCYLRFKPLVRLFKPITIPFILQEFWRKIDHIPLYGYSVRGLFLTTTLTE